MHLSFQSLCFTETPPSWLNSGKLWAYEYYVCQEELEEEMAVISPATNMHFEW